MKKIAKLSLVAAVAVAGLSTANAQPLEEAIKNVDVSGTVVYRYDDAGLDKASDSEEVSDGVNNNYKVGVSLSSKVTDDVKFNTRVLAASTSGSFVGGAELDTTTQADSNPGVTLSHANFAYTGIANTTVIVGKQGLQTPWTNAIDSDGSEQTGTGVLALSTMGPVTVAGGYFNQTNLAAGNDLMVAGVLGAFGPVKAQAWYLDLDEALSQYFVKAEGSVGPVNAFAQYSDQDTDNVTTNDDINLLKVGGSVKFGIVNAGLTYAKSGKDGAGILNSVASQVSAIGYTVNMNTAADGDAEAYFVDLGVQVLPSLHLGLNYDVKEVNKTKDGDIEEIFLQATYSHSKNLSAYVRLADGSIDSDTVGEVDYNRGRLQVEYKF